LYKYGFVLKHLGMKSLIYVENWTNG
jgi:hypothetical protein